MINFTESLTAGVPITERNTFLASDLNAVLGYDSKLKGELPESELYRFLMSGDCDFCRKWQWNLALTLKGTDVWKTIL